MLGIGNKMSLRDKNAMTFSSDVEFFTESDAKTHLKQDLFSNIIWAFEGLKPNWFAYVS